MSYKHLLGLPLRHKMEDIEGLLAELQTLMKLDGSRKAELIDIDGSLGGHTFDKILTRSCMLKVHPTIPYVYWRKRDDSGFASFFGGNVYAYMIKGHVYAELPIYTGAAANNRITLNSYDGEAYQSVLKAIGGECQISRAGDVAFLDDKFLKIGKDSDASLPPASAEYRGKIIRVEGGAGEADHFYGCRKLADESYEWTQLD